MPRPPSAVTDIDTLDERLRAVERAVSDVSGGGSDDAVALSDPDDDLRERLADLETQATELDAAVQAVRGYVGEIRSVNDEVEHRADAALAAVEGLEGRVDDLESTAGQSRPAASIGGASHPGNPRSADPDGRQDADIGGQHDTGFDLRNRSSVGSETSDSGAVRNADACPCCRESRPDRDVPTAASSNQSVAPDGGDAADSVDERGLVARLRSAL